MAGQIRLFEKTKGGLLTEVDPATSREGRRISHVNISIDVLWTAEEEAAADAEAADSQIAAEAAQQAVADKVRDRTAVLAKLGLSEDEAKALLP